MKKLSDWIEFPGNPNFTFFWGHSTNKDYVGKECLSQWYPSPIVEHGRFFFTAEHYMMFHKAQLFDPDKCSDILRQENPADAKMHGRDVENFDPVIWDRVKYDIVLRGNILKFTQHPDLCEYLHGTGDDIIVEASPFDKTWGIGLKASDPDAKNPERWKGQNLLGFVLMDTRKLIRCGAT